MPEGIYVTGADGEDELLRYEDIDPELLPKLIKPVGGFIFEGGAYLHLPLATAPYWIKDWLPKQGRLVLYGQPKAGKSYLCLQLARMIAAGETFLGQPTNPARVLYIQSELGAEILQKRMQSTGQPYDNVYVGTTFSMKLDTDVGKRILLKAVDAVEPDVLILDPLYKMHSMEDENSSSEMMPILNFLDELVDTGIAVVVIHHAGKDLTRGGRGTNALQAWVDSNIEIKRVNSSGDPLRVRLTPRDLRHAELPPEPAEAEFQNFEFVKVVAKGTVYDTVLAFFRDHDGIELAPKDLMAAELGGHKSIADSLTRLVQDEELKKTGHGKYIFCGKVEEVE